MAQGDRYHTMFTRQASSYLWNPPVLTLAVRSVGTKPIGYL
jgi:hypothetical protein